MSRYVGLQQQIVSSVDDDLKIGVVIVEKCTIHVSNDTSYATLPGWTAGSRYETRTWKARSQQYRNSPPPIQLGAMPKKKEWERRKERPQQRHFRPKRDNHPKQRQRIESCNGEECFYCQQQGHVRSDCRKRQKDLALAEGRPEAAAATADAGASTSNTTTLQLGRSASNLPIHVKEFPSRHTAV